MIPDEANPIPTVPEYAHMLEISEAHYNAEHARWKLEEQIAAALDDRCRAAVIADHLNVSRATVYRMAARHRDNT